MHLTCWPFRWKRQCASTVPSALPNASCSELQLKPLDTAIGQIFAPYCPGNCQGPIQTSKKYNQNKCISLAGNFDGQGNAPVRYQAHQPMCCAQRFNWIHWTPQLVNYWLRIAPATARVPCKQAKEHNQTKKQTQRPTYIAQAKKTYICIVFCTSQVQTLPAK